MRCQFLNDSQYPALIDEARKVLHTLVFSEKQVSASNNRWFTVKIMPYRTHENRINGLVITFNDITFAKKLEESLREIEKNFRFLIDTMPVGILLQQSDGYIVCIVCLTLGKPVNGFVIGIAHHQDQKTR